MAEEYYQSAYTGAQIDNAIGRIVNGEIDQLAESAANSADLANQAVKEVEELVKDVEDVSEQVKAVETARDEAVSAKDAAESAESSAEASASNAATSATSAASSASSASTYASNAKTSQTNATSSASAAKTSETAAKTAQTAAESAKDSAATSASNAAASEIAAKAAQAAAEKARDEAVTASSNTNLLDNWYFLDPINQRGQTSYTAQAYSVDRWKVGHTVFPVDVTSDGVVQRATKAITGGATRGFHQYVADPANLSGKTVTFSILLGETIGSKFYCGIRLVAGGATRNYNADITEGNSVVSVTTTLPNNITEIIVNVSGNTGVAANDSVTIKAAKLELGSAQTLAYQDADGNWVLNDPPPDKGLELLKCQRYYQIFSSADKAPSNLIDYRPTMRANPATGTIDINGATYYYADANL